MKKGIWWIVIICFVFLLTACGSNATSENTNTDSNTPESTVIDSEESPEEQSSENATEQEEKNVTEENEKKNKESQQPTEKLTAKSILEQAAEVMADISSFALELESIRESSDLGQTTTTIQLEMNYEEPMTMHQVITTQSPDMPDGSIEMYLATNGVFMYEKSQSMWFKLPEQAQSQGNLTFDPRGQTNHTLDFIDDYQLEETSDTYILTLTGNTDRYKQYVADELSTINQDIATSLTFDDYSELVLDSFTMKIVIDKNTMYQREYFYEYRIKYDAIESTETYERITMKFDKINEIDPITVPEDIVQSAQSF
ncbi:hypothetical protein EJF36_13045 [Bacillus sp. HMF5848]|uniref:DUF6612 family protein n=1 Tax=Bacillus sp. HMF5848 TaxID=2495421 RepID=UPI000F7B41F8|nr:DUF6612 family protein [Bacillus sp. HMF5848]RSK27725.1 hypothetical protein EJF36_13045 [Bacillus sp. HMF5848]